MPIGSVDLPKRSVEGAFKLSADDLQTIADLFEQGTKAVSVADAQDTESKARQRAKTAAEQVAGLYDQGTVKVRTHVITGGTKAKPTFTPAVSLKPVEAETAE